VILFIVKSGSHFGIGHLKRALNLIKILNSDTRLLIITQKEYNKFSPLLENKSHVLFARNESEALNKIGNEKITPQAVIIDCRYFGKNLLQYFQKRHIPAIVFDDYKWGKRLSEVLVSPLPHFKKKEANFENIRYHPTDGNLANYRKSNNNGHILICFGGSDPSNIALKIVKAINKIAPDKQILVIEGPLADYRWTDNYPNTKKITAPENIYPFLQDAHTVFTTVGLTMIEALIAGKKVITVNPSRYHEKIARSFPYIINLGVSKRLSEKKIVNALDKNPQSEFNDIPDFDYKKWFDNLVKTVGNKNAKCPLCGEINRRAISRIEEFTLFECERCKSNYLYILDKGFIDYEDDYFEAKYRNAYEKTYIEDIENIRAYSRRRLDIIGSLLETDSRLKILDIGAGLGVFVDTARQCGFDVSGVEISRYAVKFARERFGIDLYNSVDKTDGNFDAVTMWFSLEHIENAGEILSKAGQKLKRGGILALGLPNARGAFALLNRKFYLSRRPKEHFFEPSAEGIRSLLKSKGFEIIRMEYFGLHPQRIGLPRWEIFRNLQKALKLGDTFEIYAEKT